MGAQCDERFVRRKFDELIARINAIVVFERLSFQDVAILL